MLCYRHRKGRCVINESIYLDNAGTTFPKPKEVADAVCRFIAQEGVNVGRGGYRMAYRAEEMVYETRQLLCALFHAPDGRNVIFTKNATESLNVLLKGLLRPGDHALVSAMEHNAVMRPLRQLEKTGCAFSRIPCDATGALQADAMEGLLTERTRAVVMTHASNVCGTLLPIAQVGRFCEKHGLRLIVDAAQTAGVVPLDMEAMRIDALAFTGHKGLLGPQGIGGFALTDELAREIEPLLSGGTGSMSHSEEVPNFLPDRYEPGTMNLPGIAGLRAALTWLNQTGMENALSHELSLTRRLLSALRPLEDEGLLRIVGRRDTTGRTGVVSVQTTRLELAQVAFRLGEEYGIMARVGLQCAPSAHRALGTFPLGTLRFSFGWFNTDEDADAVARALEELCHGV